MTFSNKLLFYQEVFGLQNWKIILQEQKEDFNNQNAMTVADPRYKRATITIWPQLLRQPGIWDEIIIHELVHVVMALYDFYVDNLGKEIKNEKGEVITDELFFIAREAAVSELTTVMTRIMHMHRDGDM